MNIGLVPLLYTEYNYGGVLQFFALQNVLKRMGFKCYIIKFDNDSKVCKSATLDLKGIVLRIVLPVINYNKRKKTYAQLGRILCERYKKTDEFRACYYVDTVPFNARSINCFSTVICGSDQIWNPEIARNRCMLKYVPDNVNKVIYAASLGSESMTDYQKKCFKPLVERLQHVSVREYSAKRILADFVDNIDIKVTVDPTLLMGGEEWRTISRKPQSHDVLENYVFTYFLGETKGCCDSIREYAKKNNSKIVSISYASGESVIDTAFGDDLICDASPDEFLYLIDHAKCIFTDSFHACVFSILFRKNFFVYQRDGKSKMMGRLNTLLNNFGFSDRIVDDHVNLFNYSSIDWSHVEDIRKDLAADSVQFLRESIENA